MGITPFSLFNTILFCIKNRYIEPKFCLAKGEALLAFKTPLPTLDPLMFEFCKLLIMFNVKLVVVVYKLALPILTLMDRKDPSDLGTAIRPLMVAPDGTAPINAQPKVKKITTLHPMPLPRLGQPRLSKKALIFIFSILKFH
jgi:hypothetical protein